MKIIKLDYDKVVAVATKRGFASAEEYVSKIVSLSFSRKMYAHLECVDSSSGIATFIIT